MLSSRLKSPATPTGTHSWHIAGVLKQNKTKNNPKKTVVSFSRRSINSSICIHTGFPDVARSQNHNLHRLVGYTVHQGILRNGDQQKIARPAAAVHGSWHRVASQPHLALLGNTPEQQNPWKVCSNIHSNVPARSATWNLRALLRFLLLTLILVLCVQSSKSPNIPPVSLPV